MGLGVIAALTCNGERGRLALPRFAGERVPGQAGIRRPAILLPRRLDVQIALGRHHEPTA